MVAKDFTVKKVERLSKSICDEFSDLSYEFIQKIIRNKDVKVNGKRVSKDVVVNLQDLVTIYYKEVPLSLKDDIKFEDENLIIIFKHRGIEVCDAEDCLLNRLKLELGVELFPVHRLDRNTEGLVMFAKSLDVQNELYAAIKQHKIGKYYYALVFGMPTKKHYDLNSYWRKDPTQSIVNVVDESKPGYVKIQTKFDVLNSKDGKSLLSVELVTGKTHQIRAHLAHAGYPIVGDEKYGNSKLNKVEKMRYQCLCAYKIKFNLDSASFLNYLNSINIEIDKSEIDFCKKM